MSYKSKFAAYQATIVFYGDNRTLQDFYMPRKCKAVLLGSIQYYRQVRLITGHKNKKLENGLTLDGASEKEAV